MKSTKIRQKLMIPFPNDDLHFELLVQNLSILSGTTIKPDSSTNLIKYDCIELIRKDNAIIMSWLSDMTSDTVADTLIAIIGETSRTKLKMGYIPTNEDKISNLVKILRKSYGSNNVINCDDSIIVTIGDEYKASIDAKTLQVTCDKIYAKQRIEREIFHYINSIERFCRCSHC